ncbi:MAG: glutathione S-transferase family protein [Granulosicoccus sp.]|nr:glutathione S-transferase family protein [Granulosicoccus sp.]
MTYTVYNFSGAPRGWRVLVGLTIKQLEYDVQYLEGSKGEHKEPEYLAIQPRSTVPTMVADEFVLRDSVACLAWLDQQHSENPLFGATAAESATIWNLTMECNDYLRDAVQQFLYPVLVENIPLPNAGSAPWEKLLAASNLLHNECSYLNGLLQDQPYLCGARASAAEAVAFPEIRLIERGRDRRADAMNATGFDQFHQRYPELSQWLRRVESLEGMDKTFPIHWSN